ncbi:hypothetical protein BOW55_08505 [Flavobacterium sp. YO12]|nr:hypothetical protein BOW55_08505 [Flavobacterium sp. YO12]
MRIHSVSLSEVEDQREAPQSKSPIFVELLVWSSTSLRLTKQDKKKSQTPIVKLEFGIFNI